MHRCDILGYIGVYVDIYLFLAIDAHGDIFFLRYSEYQLLNELDVPFVDIPVLKATHSIIIDGLKHSEMGDILDNYIVGVLYESKRELLIHSSDNNIKYRIISKDAYRYSVIYTDENLEFIEGL